MNKKISEIGYEEQTYLATIAKGAGVDIVGKVVNTGLRYGFVIMLARFLGAHDMGIFFLSVVIINFLGVLSRLGLESGVLKYAAIYNADHDRARLRGIIIRAFQIAGIASLLFGGLVFIGADSLAALVFKKPELGIILRIMSIALPFSTIMFIANSTTQAFHTLKYRVIVESITNPVLNMVLGFILLYMGYGVKQVAYVYVAGFIVCGFLSIFYVVRLFPRLLDNSLKPLYETRSWIRFSSPLLLVNFLGMFMLWTDTLMIGYFRSGAEVGIYNTVVRTAFFINFVIISFTSIFAPRISELYHKRKISELGSLFKIVTKWIITLSTPVFVIIMVAGKSILTIFGSEFTAGLLCLLILSSAHFFNAFVGPVRYILMMSEKEQLVMIDTFLISMINLILNIFFIPRYGINGAAIATAISIILINLLMLYQVYTHLKVQPFDLTLWKPLISGGLVLLCVMFIQSRAGIVSLHIDLLYKTVISVLLYGVTMRIFGFSERDNILIQAMKAKITSGKY